MKDFSRSAASPTPYRRADGLLEAIVTESLDPSYAAAARRRAASPPEPHRRRWMTPARVGGLAALVVAGTLLALAAQQTEARRGPAAQTREALSAQVADLAADIRQAEERLTVLRAELAARRQASLDEADPEESKLLDRLSVAQGASSITPVRGPGVVVRVDDAPGTRNGRSLDPREQADIDAGRVIDRDLQAVVNGLWAAGAEAVTVGEHRLSSLSAIRAAGLAILVDYKYVLPPYDIRAIGDPDRLAHAVERGAAGEQLRDLRDDLGVRFSVGREDSLFLPAAHPGPLRWASVVDSSTGVGSSSGTIPPTEEGNR